MQIALKLAMGGAKALTTKPAFAAMEVDTILGLVKAAIIDPVRTLWNPKTWVFIVTMEEDAWQALDLETQRVRLPAFNRQNLKGVAHGFVWLVLGKCRSVSLHDVCEPFKQPIYQPGQNLGSVDVGDQLPLFFCITSWVGME